MKEKSKFSISTTHKILLRFMLVILFGAFLLMLPISSADGEATPFIDALFTATTSTCVTGLTVLNTAQDWSTFGHVVILILIQIGGLGIITVMAGFALFLNKKVGLSDRVLIQDSFNLDSLSGLVKFVRKVILGTFIVEACGALLYMTVFVPEFGARGIWISVFTSISAFCNAGLDIIGDNSLCNYATNPMINFVTCALIFLGGIGYIVWWDVIRVIKTRRERKIKMFASLTLHSKIALTATAILIFGGAVLIFIFEYNNPLTMGNQSLYNKIQMSFFQSVTTRTAGFATMAQENLTNASVYVSILLMFIGGSPVGTAGGIKTVTMAVLISVAMASFKNKNHANMFNRSIAKDAIAKAVGVTAMSFAIVFTSTVLLSLVCKAPAIDIIYETASATATVGLSRNLTMSLNDIGKAIIIGAMYLGRVGPISLAVAFNFKKEKQNIITNPVEGISVG